MAELSVLTVKALLIEYKSAYGTASMCECPKQFMKCEEQMKEIESELSRRCSANEPVSEEKVREILVATGCIEPFRVIAELRKAGLNIGGKS